VLSLGISNCYALPALQKLFADAAIKPSVLQNRHLPAKSQPIPPSETPANSPSHRALRFYADTSYDCDVRAWCQLHSVTNHKAVQDAAKAAGVTPEQVMRMAWKGGGGGGSTQLGVAFDGAVHVTRAAGHVPCRRVPWHHASHWH
jgi:diketogulonate reductase-like aldo/keto reductase